MNITVDNFIFTHKIIFITNSTKYKDNLYKSTSSYYVNTLSKYDTTKDFRSCTINSYIEPFFEPTVTGFLPSLSSTMLCSSIQGDQYGLAIFLDSYCGFFFTVQQVFFGCMQLIRKKPTFPHL